MKVGDLLEVFKPKPALLRVGDKGTCEAKTPEGLAHMRFATAAGSVDEVRGRRFTFKYKMDDDDPWVFLYVKGNKARNAKPIFDCNPMYFEKHFSFQRTNKRKST